MAVKVQDFIGLNLAIRRTSRHTWVVEILDSDERGDSLGTIDTLTLGSKLPVFKPTFAVKQEGIGAEFMLEICMAMIVIQRDEMEAECINQKTD